MQLQGARIFVASDLMYESVHIDRRLLTLHASERH